MDAPAASSTDQKNDLSALARQIEQAGRRAAEEARQRAAKSRSAVYYADPTTPSQVVQEFPDGEAAGLERRGGERGRTAASCKAPPEK